MPTWSAALSSISTKNGRLAIKGEGELTQGFLAELMAPLRPI